MKRKSRIAFAIFAWSFMACTGFASELQDEYTQTYVVFIDGERSGKEIVTESVAGNGDRLAQTENELYVTDGLETNRMAYTTRIVLDGKSLQPKSYMYRYVAGSARDHYEVTIQGDTITRTLSRGGAISSANTEFKKDCILLDINVYHQYDYLIQRYDEKKGGRQLFSDYIPVIGDYIPLALTHLGDSTMRHAKGTIDVKEYQVEFVGLRTGTVLTDKSGRLVRLVIPNQNLEVVREDLLPANR